MSRKREAESQRRQRQINDVEYVNSAEALSILGVRRETLYTYVSRGMIKTTRPAGSRTKLYRKADVEGLRSRAVARSGGPQVSHALRYGAPIAQTWISEITVHGPRYRGVLASDLVRDGRSFEFTSELIWTGVSRSRDVAWPTLPEGKRLESRVKWGLQAWELASPLKLLSMLTTSLSAFEQAEVDFQTPGISACRQLLQTLAAATGVLGPKKRVILPLEGEFIAQCLARGLGLEDRPDAVRALDAALVLSAEHELSAPTFVARICASTGADLHACVASAMLTQSGAMQAGGAGEVEALIDCLPEQLKPDQALMLAAASGFKSNELPCFTHPLYDGEDPRSAILLDIAGRLSLHSVDLPKMLALVKGAREVGRYPNVFAALVILCKAMGLPNGSGAMLHTLARTSGWMAHAMEQRLTGAMLRPRAKYMGTHTPR